MNDKTEKENDTTTIAATVIGVALTGVAIGLVAALIQERRELKRALTYKRKSLKKN